MQISETLKISWQDVLDSGVPPEIQTIAFQEAVGMRTGRYVSSTATPSGITTPQRKTATVATPGGTPIRLPGVASSQFAMFADETGISAVELQDVFLLGDDGEIEILPPARKLGSSVADRTRTVTILIAGARHVLQRARTPVEDIRRICMDKGCYDGKNFKSKHLGHFDAINVRNDEIIVNASKWLTSFTAAVKTARGEVAE